MRACATRIVLYQVFMGIKNLEVLLTGHQRAGVGGFWNLRSFRRPRRWQWQAFEGEGREVRVCLPACALCPLSYTIAVTGFYS